MNLSANDRKLLSVCLHRANESVRELSLRSKVPEHSVRYSLGRLLNSKIIQRQVYLDVYPLGLSYYVLYFSLSSEMKRKTQRLLNHLIKSPRVAYLVELGGEYEYCMDVCVRHVGELADFLAELSREFGTVFDQKTFTSMISLTDMPLGFDLVNRNQQELFAAGVSKRRVEIDQLDHRILSNRSSNPDHSNKELASALGISQTTLDYRLQRLEKERVIVGYRYSLDASQLGMQSFVHLIYLRGLSGALRDEFFAFCKECQSVYYFLEIAGSWDFEIGTSVQAAQEVIEILQNIRDTFGNSIAKISTIPMFAHRKVSKYPFPENWKVADIVG